MTQQNRTTLKGYFNTGDVPTEAQFADLIDSFHNPSNDGEVQVAPAEGAFVDGDKTKLDGIEALADVTDAANVKASIEGITLTSISGATGDEVLVVDATDNLLKAVLWENLPGIGGGLTTFSVAADTGTPEVVGDGGVLTLTGGTGISTVVAATDTVTFAIDSTVATLTGTQTLTNKTIAGGSGSAVTNTILVRNDSAAQWTSNNPTLSAGEFGVESDTGQLKIGDGATAWTSLDYISIGQATASDVNGGSSTTLAVTPDALAGSNFGTQVVQLLVFDDSEDVAVGDGAGSIFFRVPSTLNGMNLVGVAAQVQTAGTTGTTDIQIHNVTDAADMLTTKITIDSGETDSATAAAAAVINGAADDVATGDSIRIDVDAVSTTPPKGLLVELQFRLP